MLSVLRRGYAPSNAALETHRIVLGPERKRTGLWAPFGALHEVLPQFYGNRTESGAVGTRPRDRLRQLPH